MSVAIENGDGTYNLIAGKAFGVAKFGELRTNWLNGHTSAATAITADCDGLLLYSYYRQASAGSFSGMHVFEDNIDISRNFSYTNGFITESYVSLVPIRKGHLYHYTTDGSVTHNFYPFIENIVTPIESKDIYSTEETVVGQWIDGKPIYRKCFENVPNNTKLNISNPKTIVKCFWVDSTGQIMFNYDSYHRSQVIFTNGELIARFENQTSIMNVIIVEYTKTTD